MLTLDQTVKKLIDHEKLDRHIQDLSYTTYYKNTYKTTQLHFLYSIHW